ncbi:hypothetical protein M422DRAFT_105714, partial [Sphaerobolus stellatus SS14]
CIDCDTDKLQCNACVVESHSCCPLHRIKQWNGTFFEDSSLPNAGLVLKLGHDPTLCLAGGTRIQYHLMTVMDVTGLHNVRLSWCRCYGFRNLAEEIFRLRWIPATLVHPGTAFTFRVMKQFQMLSHVARTTAWDFCTTLQRITDNVQPDLLPKIYRSFNQVQRHWRVMRAYKRGGLTKIRGEEASSARLGLQCVSCPWPGKNIPDNWQADPDADLIYATFMAVDGNYRLSRNKKGGGEAVDPSFFGDNAFYAPNSDYKEYCRVRGGADDELADITCRGHKTGDAKRFNNSARKASSGIVCGVCGRSAAFFHHGTVDLAIGERFVNVDFAVVNVLLQLVKSGLKRIVVSYDVACKYNINFEHRITHKDWPLVSQRELRQFKNTRVDWLVPKFHLAAHVDGC